MTFVARVTEDAGALLVAEPVHDGYVDADQDVTRSAEEGGEAAGAPEAGARVAAALAARIGAGRYDLWFDRKTRLIFGGNTLFVEAPNEFWVGSIRTKFSEDLRTAAAEVLGRGVELIIRVAERQAAAAPAVAATDAAPVAASARGAAAPAMASISARYTLEDFVVGPSNQMAYHAALQVAAHPGAEFNPLFIHGACGLGKTHLLQGICHRFARLHPTKKWLYLTGEQFTNEFLEAIKTHKTEQFRRRMRSTDLLAIDDVHFLSHKKATQEEFLHTFNQVEVAGRQVVLASDCAPRHIESLSEPLASRFVSGMVLRVDSPDLPTRVEILRRRAARSGWAVADAVLMHIAQSAPSSVRELEGLLLQAVASMRLIEGAPDAGAVAGVLADLRQRTGVRGPVAVERIVAVVAEHFSLEAAVIMGKCKQKVLSAARAVAMYLARQHTGMSYPEIGRALGHKNHSSVIASCQRVEGLIAAAELVCWNTPEGPKHQAISDVLHELEAALRRPAGGGK